MARLLPGRTGQHEKAKRMNIPGKKKSQPKLTSNTRWWMPMDFDAFAHDTIGFSPAARWALQRILYYLYKHQTTVLPPDSVLQRIAEVSPKTWRYSIREKVMEVLRENLVTSPGKSNGRYPSVEAIIALINQQNGNGDGSAGDPQSAAA
jgi:hypothetical protein